MRLVTGASLAGRYQPGQRGSSDEPQHLKALHELPGDVIIRPRLVVTRGSGERIAKRITAPPRPAKRLRALLKGDGN
jgi:hypothetical protein